VRIFKNIHHMSSSSSSSANDPNDLHPLLSNKERENDYHTDIESKLTKNEVKTPSTVSQKTEETSFNTQAFWLIVWMAK
jgi:hypothetical protein